MTAAAPTTPIAVERDPDTAAAIRRAAAAVLIDVDRLLSRALELCDATRADEQTEAIALSSDLSAAAAELARMLHPAIAACELRGAHAGLALDSPRTWGALHELAESLSVAVDDPSMAPVTLAVACATASVLCLTPNGPADCEGAGDFFLIGPDGARRSWSDVAALALGGAS